MTDGPLIVQSDKTLLLEIDHELSDECRHSIAPFAELERAPEHIHTYRITNLGLWNARAANHDAEFVIDALLKYSRYPVPHALLVDIAETMARYGRLSLHMHPVHGLILQSSDRTVLEEVLRSKKITPLVGKHVGKPWVQEFCHPFHDTVRWLPQFHPVEPRGWKIMSHQHPWGQGQRTQGGLFHWADTKKHP